MSTVSLPRPAVTDEGVGRAPSRVRPGRIALRSNLVLVYLFLYAPIVILLVFSFNASRSQAVWTGFSLQWYRAMLDNTHVHEAARTSLGIAAVTTLFATAIGTGVALALERTRFRAKRAFESAMYLPLVVPEIVIAIALLLFFNLGIAQLRHLGLDLTLGLTTITIAHIAVAFPFVAVVVRARLADADLDLEEAAQDLGANEWQTFRRITLPLLMPAILAAALLAFTTSIDNFVITLFTTGPGVSTLPLELYSQVRQGITPEVNAISAALLVFSLSLVFAATVLQRKE